MEETHYYPFGLTMAGISSKALKPNYVENKYKYNDGTELSDKEFNDGSGLELYETDFRGYDPQIGRFLQIDQFADFAAESSPYSYANNNPINFVDPFGLAADSANPTPAPGFINTPGTAPVLSPVVIIVPPKTPSKAKGVPNFIEPGTVPEIPEPTIVPEIPEPSFEPVLPPVSVPILTTMAFLWPQSSGQSDRAHDPYHPLFPPNPNQWGQINEDDKRNNKYFVRFGPGPETHQTLGDQSYQAWLRGFPYGISVRLRNSIKDNGRYALVSEVRKYFRIYKTGELPDHYTIEMPKPITNKTLQVFNTLFKPK